MKKLLSLLFAVALSMPMCAQYGWHHARTAAGFPSARYAHDAYFGLRLGAGFATVSSDDRQLDGGSTKTGLNVGIAAGYQLIPSSPLYFETGLYYTEKGGKGNYEGKKFSYNLNYLELPLLLKYAAPFADRGTVQPYVGGYLACGIGGKVKDYGNRQAFSSFDDNYFKRFDGGLRLGCGVQYDIVYAEAAYEFGLANICNDSFDTSHNRCFYLNVGVNF